METFKSTGYKFLNSVHITRLGLKKRKIVSKFTQIVSFT